MAQSGVESSGCINTWGDLRPVSVESHRKLSETERPIEAPSSVSPAVPQHSAVEAALKLVRHAVLGEPLPTLLSIDPNAGRQSLLSRPPTRQWQPVRGWADAPAEHSGRYIGVYSKVSVAVQTALREWIPCLYFDSIERLEEADLTCGLIAWRASRPAIGKHVDCLAYDVLDRRMMERCFHWIDRNFADELKVLRPFAAKLGPTRWEAFNPALANRILVRVKRSQRGLYSMLKAEEDIVTQIVKLASMIPRLRAKAATQHRSAAAEVDREVRRTFATIELRLKRFAPKADFSAVAGLVLTVFTETLEQTVAKIEAKIDANVAA